MRYWVRRAVVSFPLWLFFVHESDTRVYDNGERVFLNYEGMVLWTIIFGLLWVVADLAVSDRKTRRNHR